MYHIIENNIFRQLKDLNLLLQDGGTDSGESVRSCTYHWLRQEALPWTGRCRMGKAGHPPAQSWSGWTWTAWRYGTKHVVI